MDKKIFFYKNKQKLRQTYELINNAQNILLISHERPDGDTSGSSMAMAYMLESFGKSVTLFNKDKLPNNFSFIEKIIRI
jgi:phosphoesterase RecJ-like protein